MKDKTVKNAKQHIGKFTYHNISITGSVSLCSLVCDRNKNIRYSSGDAPEMEVDERPSGEKSFSSGLCRDDK